MANHNVGDRVRINYPESKLHGLEATIWEISIDDLYDDDGTIIGKNILAHSVDIDGWGKGDEKMDFAFEAHELIPITNPDAAITEQIRRLFLPKPSLICAKEKN